MYFAIMKKALKFLIYILIGIALSIVVFFLWASSPNHTQKDYSKIIINNYNQKIDNDSIYSIVTYNIGYLSGMTNNRPIAKPKELFDNNLEKVTKEFELLNTDIIAFQEIDYASARSYKTNQQNEIAKLGYNYIAEAVNWDEKYVPFPEYPISMHFGEMYSGQSIISKYPIKDHQRIVLKRVQDNPFYRDLLYLERLAQIATITIENKDVVVINIHLEAFDKPTRVKQMNFVIDLFKEYSQEYPTILLGDFNSKAGDNDAIIKKVFALPAIGNAAFGSKYEYTFDSANPTKRIDYIFYTENSIEYIDGKVLTQFGQASDHLPVEMQFRLK